MNKFKVKKIFIKLIMFTLLTSCSVFKQQEEQQIASSRIHHITERPYVINGIKYYPQTTYKYDKIGYSSWYGSECQGLKTATGKRFDKNLISAAHRTLPLPSVVKITNLKNGRSAIVVVNDRGPFAQTNKRIIDVSEKVAKILNFYNSGCAKVRVTCIPAESKKIAKRYGKNPY